MPETIDFVTKEYTDNAESGFFSWSAPSNIALVKYWGKKEGQLPANPSLSFTLEKCRSVTSVSFEKKNSGTPSFDFFFEGRSKPGFNPKIAQFLERANKYLPFLNNYHFTIHSQNTFPHSSGIASSASAMAALSVNLMSIERLLMPEMTEDYFYQKASFLARLGSGSACRSIRGNAVVWGAHADIPGSSDLYGEKVAFALHPVFETYRDTILLVDKGQKTVSSTAGHSLMHGHPFAERRFSQANDNLGKLVNALKEGNLEDFIAITESEALTLHAMMMTSTPYFLLMKPNTLEIINRIWDFRSQSKIPVCFTLDAGANVHLLYPAASNGAVLDFIKSELVAYCENGHYICDETGDGARPEPPGTTI